MCIRDRSNVAKLQVAKVAPKITTKPAPATTTVKAGATVTLPPAVASVSYTHLSDPAVKGILVNIFGGIMKCDIIARGVIAAARNVKLTVPLVVRLEGTNVKLGKEILAQSGLAITSADSLADAAQKIVGLVKAAK